MSAPKEDTKNPSAYQEWKTFTAYQQWDKRRMIEIDILGVPPTMNTMLDQHWLEYQKEKKEWVKKVKVALGTWPPSFHIKEPVTVEFDRGWCGVPADMDNAAASSKFILDALVVLNVVPDDNPLYIKELVITQTRYAKRKQVATSIVIYPYSDE